MSSVIFVPLSDIKCDSDRVPGLDLGMHFTEEEITEWCVESLSRKPRMRMAFQEWATNSLVSWFLDYWLLLFSNRQQQTMAVRISFATDADLVAFKLMWL